MCTCIVKKYFSKLGSASRIDALFKNLSPLYAVVSKNEIEGNAHYARFPQSRFSTQLSTKGKGLKARQFLKQTQGMSICVKTHMDIPFLAECRMFVCT